MVPVPEELVTSVKDYMKWKLNAPKVAERPDAVQTVWEEADAPLRSMLHYTARITMEDGLPTLTEVAEACGMSKREVIGAVGDLQGRLRSAGRASLLILPRDDPRERPDGVGEWEHRVLNMSEVDAKLIIDLV